MIPFVISTDNFNESLAFDPPYYCWLSPFLSHFLSLNLRHTHSLTQSLTHTLTRILKWFSDGNSIDNRFNGVFFFLLFFISIQFTLTYRWSVEDEERPKIHNQQSPSPPSWRILYHKTARDSYCCPHFNRHAGLCRSNLLCICKRVSRKWWTKNTSRNYIANN